MANTRIFHKGSLAQCLWVFLLVSLSGCVISTRELVGSGSVIPTSFDTSLATVQIRDAVAVEVRLAGANGLYILDTGASISVIDRLPLDGRRIRVAGAGVAEESMVTDRLASLRLGAVAFVDTYGASGDLEDLTRSVADLRGLIGQPVLSKADWLIDYDNAILRLSDRLQPPSDMQEVPLVYRRGLPYATVEVDGQAVDALLDSAATSHLVIPESSALATYLTERYPFATNERQIFAIGGTRTVSQRTATIPHMDLGGMRFRDIPVEIRDTRRPRIGARFLADRGKILLRGGGNLWLKP